MKPGSDRRAAKAERQRAVSELIARNLVASQDELLHLLEADGWVTTQSTLSRDLRELGIRKSPEGYVLPRSPRRERTLRRKLSQSIRRRVESAERGGTIVVVRTRRGDAVRVAREIEQADLHEVIGTIAGEDTVFVASPTAAQARGLLRLFVD